MGAGRWSDRDFVFCTKARHWAKENILYRISTPLRKKLHLETLNFQVLRRTCATLAQHSGSIHDVAARLRHRTTNVTAAEYVQPIDDTTRAANVLYDQLTNEPATS
jgi:integrase